MRGPAVHGTGPNDLFQFDYIDSLPVSTGEKFVPTLRDDHSSYFQLFTFLDTVSENAARAVIYWCAVFGVPRGLMPMALLISKIKRSGWCAKANVCLTTSHCPTLLGATRLTNA